MSDISEFMSWWINQVITIMINIYNTLDSIRFFNTSLFDVIIGTTILSIGIPIFLTIGKGIASKGERVVNNGRFDQ